MYKCVHFTIIFITENTLILTTLSETPEASGAGSSNLKGASTDLILGLGTGEATSALVQCVVARVTTCGGLTWRHSTRTGQGLAQIDTEIGANRDPLF